MIRRILSVSSVGIKEHFFTPGFIFLLFFFFGIPFWCTTFQGDGTAAGQFKVFVTYSFLLVSIILIFVNIALSCSSISGEFKKKTIFLLDSKPIRRWEIITGKFFSLLILNGILILCFILSMFVSSIKLSNSIKKKFGEEKNIYMTYEKIFPSVIITKKEEKPVTEKRGVYSIPPRGQLTWRFGSVKNPSSQVYLVFKFFTSKQQEENITGYWLIKSKQQKTPVELLTTFSSNKVHKLEIPAQVIGKSEELEITYINIDPQNRSILFDRENFHILYPWSNYWNNLLRSFFVLLFSFGFISGLGVFFSTLTSTLTAAISTGVLVFIAYLHDFVIILMNSMKEENAKFFSQISYYLMKFSLFLVPPLNKFLPHSLVGDSILLPLNFLFEIFMKTMILGVFPYLLIAIMYFNRKELGVFYE